VLYTGDGSYPRTITGVGFQPDLVWTKARSTTYSHILYDAVRGTGTSKNLSANETGAEGGNSTNANLTAFASDGFTVGTTSATNVLNNSGTTIVAWNWKANGTGSTNTAGTITSTVSANTTSGFSICTFTSGAPGTVGHGLGVAPSMIILKSRNNVSGWSVYHSSVGNTGALNLQTTGGISTSSDWWSNTSPTSSVFSIGANIINGWTWVGYAFAAIPGYSAFGSYTGNGSTDGPFVYCGFRPRWVIIKCFGTTSNWTVFDTLRDGYNPDNQSIYANLSAAESTADDKINILSNGFKVIASAQGVNESTYGFIYAAFAENPLKFSNAR